MCTLDFYILYGIYFLNVFGNSEGESIGSASCESYASGQSQAFPLQGESYTHSQTSQPPVASVGLFFIFLINDYSLKSLCRYILTIFLTQQTTGALPHPQMLPIGESGSVPSIPLGQSVSMTSMSVGQSGGGPVAQTFLQSSNVVPQVSPSVPQQYFQVKMVIMCIFNTGAMRVNIIFNGRLTAHHICVLFHKITVYATTNHPHNHLRLASGFTLHRVSPRRVYQRW